jgi:heme/copper-type cytochrome/quinol oxidase subunit 2
MEQDTIRYDSLGNRPLPKWLTDQKEGLTTIQPQKIVMKEDKSMTISFALTGAFILLVVAFLTIYVLRKNKNQSSS